MHILSTSVPIPNRNGAPGNELEAGEWLLNDESAFKLAVRMERRGVTVKYWAPPVATSDPRSILIIRNGAFGDLLMLSPCIGPLRAKYPNAKITLAANPKFHPVIWDENSPYHHLNSYPVPVDSLADYDFIIPLENVVELETEKHAIDAFADVLGVTVTDYRPVYKVTDEERQHAEVLVAHDLATKSGRWKRKPRVALQLRASARIRDYHMEHWGEVVSTLLAGGWEVMLIGQNNPDIRPLGTNIKDCSALSFREATAVLSTCDVFCGVDSAFFNLCPALGVPAIGLFGPVNWRTRVKEGMGQRALAGVGDCAPCGWTNSRAGQKFPPFGPCAKTGYCVPLAEIKPERVVAMIEKYARRN